MPVLHNIAPVYDSRSRVLILGSFPSVRSRETGFYYGHPQNRFWQVTAAVFGCETPVAIDEKRAFLLYNRVALWDVAASCEIDGCSDSSIRSVVANDIAPILRDADIERIFVNGKTAARLYDRHILPATGRRAECLPSTSPANAAWTLPRLIEAWAVINTRGRADGDAL